MLDCSQVVRLGRSGDEGWRSISKEVEGFDRSIDC